MTVRVQLVTERWNPISAAIRYSTRSWCSHAEFIIDGAHTFGARSHGGVRHRLSAHDHYSRVEQFTAEGIDEAYAWALSQAGKPYDYSAILGIALDRNWRDPKRWFCSELICAAFESAGAPLLSTRPSDAVYRITPRDLLLSSRLVYLPPEK